MWKKWEHAENKSIKSEKYKDSAFIDLYKTEDYFEIICSVKDCIMFHTIVIKNTEAEILKTYEDVKHDLKNIIDNSLYDKEKKADLYMDFIDKW